MSSRIILIRRVVKVSVLCWLMSLSQPSGAGAEGEGQGQQVLTNLFHKHDNQPKMDKHKDEQQQEY